MSEYISFENSPVKIGTRRIAMIFGLCFVILGFGIKSWYTGLVGFLLITSMLLEKKIMLTQEGLIVKYDILMYTYQEKWTYEEIDEIYFEYLENNDYVSFYVVKGFITRRLIYTKENYDKVVGLIKSNGPNIYISEVD